MMSEDAEDNKSVVAHQVGYGKPPVSTRFQPGKSGNPQGRPKRSSLTEALQTVFAEFVEISENGEVKQVTKVEALVKRLVQMGLKANSNKEFINTLDLLLRIEMEATKRAERKAHKKDAGEKFQGGVLIVPQPAKDSDEYMARYGDKRIPDIEWDQNGKVIFRDVRDAEIDEQK